MRPSFLTVLTLTGATFLLHCANDGEDTTTSTPAPSTTTASGAGGSGAGATTGTGGSGAGAMGGSGGDGGASTSGGGGTGGAGAGGDGGSGGSVPTVSISFVIIDAFSQSPVAGLSVCDHADSSNCATTNANGSATLTLPDTDVTVEYSGNSYRPHLIALGQGATNGTVTTFATAEALLTQALSAMSVTEDPTKGMVASGATAGAMASLIPASGAGPVYSADNGFPDPNLTTASSVGTFLFANVDPGTPELAVTHGSLTCTHDLGVMGSLPNQTPVPVEAGALTIGSAFQCQ